MADRPRLEGDRLVLEPLRVEHAQEMAVVLDDMALHTFTSGEPAKFREKAMAAGAVAYPYGTVFAVEFAHGLRDGEAQLMRDGSGTPLKADVARIDVMRRERGYGEVYGDSRAGEWEFASYRPDGTPLIAPGNAGACAACHRKAGAERDFVYGLRVPSK